MRRLLVLLLAAALAVGCAKFPDQGVLPRSTVLVFRMTVDGKIRSGSEPDSNGLPYIYMIALNPSTQENPTSQGPIPVIAPPWGNGFVAGSVQYFVWWNPQQSPRYALYKFRDTTLTEYYQVGVPINYVDVPTGGKAIEFQLDLSQLAASPEEAQSYRSLQVNFLTMDRIPTSGTQKFWDALGDGRLQTEINSPVTIPLRSSGIYDNQRAGGLEPRGDQPDPDLDIVDWSVEVRLQ